MSELTCGICLDDLKSPVSTPCGHLHCKKCMHEHVKASTDAIQSTCPTCRTPFYTVTLDPTFVPAKYHPFIIPGLRRIYLNTDPSRSSAASKLLQEQLLALGRENEDLASKLKGRDRDIKLLMTKCESTMAAVTAHIKGEREARLANERLQCEITQLAERCNALQVRLSERERQSGSSGEGEARVGDDRRGYPLDQSRLITDPSRTVNVNGPVGLTTSDTNDTPTVVHKRKHATSTISTPSSQSSSASSSSPTSSSPALNADREDNDPGARLVLRLPRRTQMAKRPRLDSTASSGGDVTASSVQAWQFTLTPPVFRRRPATPFNRPAGERGVTSDQAEGSGYIEGSVNGEVEAGGNPPDTSLYLASDGTADVRSLRRR